MEQKFQYWQRNLTSLAILSLLTVYKSGNYQVVHAISHKLMDFKLSPDKDIPFAFAFYFLTLFIPFSYIVTVVKRRLPLFIWMGMLTTLLSILTFKYTFWQGHNAFFFLQFRGIVDRCADSLSENRSERLYV